MEEDLVCVYSYPLDEKFVESFVLQGKELTNADIENDIHKILKDNLIPYKNKLVDRWCGEGAFYKPWTANDYKLVVEIYVYEVNALRAQQLIDEYINYDGEYRYDDLNNKGENNNE